MMQAPAVFAAVMALLIPGLALVALTSRSMLTIAICVGASGAILALVALALGAGDVALGAAVALGGWAPLTLVTLMLLTAGTTGRSHATLVWLIGLPVAALAVVPAFAHPGWSRSAIASPEGVALWLSLVATVVGSICVGLLAYGERGGFRRVGER